MSGKNNLINTKSHMQMAPARLQQSGVRLVQVSDTHLYGDTQGKLLGVNTHQSFSAVVQQLHQEQLPPDAYIFSGDLSHDGSKLSYQRLAHVMTHLPAPSFVCPGNHDAPTTFKHVYTSPHCHKERAFLCKRWQIILLNSQITGHVPGHLNARELKFLEMRLTQYSKYYSLIFFHHHPIPIGAKWLDPLGLNNSEELFAVIDRFPNVRGMVFGHVHQDFSGHYKHISLYGTPSTSIQFKPKSAQFKLDSIQPGYRVFMLDDYGIIHTSVKRASRDRTYLQVDAHSSGYK